MFTPRNVTVPAGQPLTIRFENRDPAQPHDIAIRVADGPKGTVCDGPCGYMLVVPPLPPGRYSFYCTIHQPAGMDGTLIVH